MTGPPGPQGPPGPSGAQGPPGDGANVTAGTGLNRNGDEFSLDTLFTDARYLLNAGVGLLREGSTLRFDTDFGDARYWRIGGNASAAALVLGTLNDAAVEVVAGGARALRIEPHVLSPSLLAGSAANAVGASAAGAVIAGGGSAGAANLVFDNFCTIGGGEGNAAGRDNAALDDAAWATVAGGRSNMATDVCAVVVGGDGNMAAGGLATVVGGSQNLADGSFAFVGGGSLNTASGGQSSIAGGVSNVVSAALGFIGSGSANLVSAPRAVVAGGEANQATADSACIGGGSSNRAEQQHAVVSGGAGNTAGGSHSAVAGGLDNVAAGVESAVGGGSGNSALAALATIGGGEANTASGVAATIPGGSGALANRHGQLAYASGSFAAHGDAQHSLYVLRGVTDSAAPVQLLLDGEGQRLGIDNGETMAFEALVVARSAGGQSAAFQVRGVIKNVANSVSLVGTPTVTTLGTELPGANVIVAPDLPNRALTIGALGVAGTPLRWVATVRAAEVSFP